MFVCSQVKQSELDQVKVQLSDAEAAVAELKQSFYDDPVSLAPWMQVGVLGAQSAAHSIARRSAWYRACCCNMPQHARALHPADTL
jgi:hypothetical protein